MPKEDRNSFRIALIIITAFILTLPVGSLMMTAGAEDENLTVEDQNQEGLIELTNEDVENLGLNSRSPPTRSEPWGTWERYSYHRDGEDGLIAYHHAENRVFIYGGGYASWSNQGGYWSYNARDDFFIYDFDTMKWYALEKELRDISPATGRFGFASVVDEANERFLIYGGWSGSMLNDLWEFDMSTLTWTDLTPGSGLIPPSFNDRRAYATMVLDTSGGGENLYLLFGMEDETTDRNPENKTDFYRIDMSTPGTLHVLNAGAGEGFLPRYHHSMCLDQAGRRIYVYGGIHEEDDDDTYLQDFWMYDIPSNTWTELTTHPNMTMSIGAQIFYRSSNQMVYLWGGRENYTGDDYLEENETLWIYDTSLGSWDRFDYHDVGTDVPSGRMYYHNHYSSLSDRFYIFGGRHYYSGWGGARSGRYSDLNYLDLPSKVWTQFPTLDNPSTNSGGIFAYEEDQGRLHYVGPNSYYDNAYTYYWDLEEEKWYGANYDEGEEDFPSRSEAGMAYDPGNKTVYVYGGYYTTGSGYNRRYWNRADMWKWEIETNTWTNIWEEAGPGERHGFDMVWNENDGSVYFFGGRKFRPEGSSDSDAYGEFYRYTYGPTGGIFQEVAAQNEGPEKRYGAGTIYVPDLNKLYITCGRDPDPQGVKDYRDLWEFDFDTMRWTELQSLTSSMISPKLDYDPLTQELYLTGGSDYIIKRYRILEDAWYNLDPDVNPGSLDGQAHVFLPEQRDLWVYGGGAKDGIWKIGMPYRLVIRAIDFEDPEDGAKKAYSMLKPYHFSTTVRTVNGPEDLADVTMSFLHRSGTYKVIYNHTTETWTESDPDDVAEVTSLNTDWMEDDFKMDVNIKFHWNFSSRPNAVDRRISVSANGIDVEPDFLEIRNFLNVENRIEIVDEISVEGELQGEVSRGDWVQTFEGLNLTGPYVRYAGSDSVYPPADSYTMTLSEGRHVPDNIDQKLLVDVYRTFDLDVAAGEPVEFSFLAPNETRTNVTYILNVTGVFEEDEELYKNFWLSVDGVAPLEPTTVAIHADDFDDSHTRFDNDMEVYVTWMSSDVSESGIMTHYWSFEDNGGTRDGNPVAETQAIIQVPSNGTHDVYIWTEDRVGNIGPAKNASITIDTESPTFEVTEPDLDQMLPYRELDIDVLINDTGGSQLNSLTIKYRFTNDGLNSEEMWTGPNAWMDLSNLWTDFPQDSIEFTFSFGKGGIPKLSDSEENFIQFSISDFAGNLVKSATYNIRVDTNLRFPMVTLEGPDEGEVFEDPEDVELNWTLDFFLPEDVVYYLYLDKDMSLVETLDESIKIERVDRFYNPLFVTHGTWYWTVIPVARDQWAGNSTNGIKSFVISQEASYSFEVTTPDEKLTRAQGTMGIPLEFNIENTGQNLAAITITQDIEGLGSISWLGGNTIEVGVGETKAKTATLDIPAGTPVGNYTLTFYFNSTFDVQREVSIALEIITPIEEGEEEEEEEDNLGLYIIMAAILVILLLMVVAIVYFMVIKKKDEGKQVMEDTGDFSDIDEELAAVEGDRPASVAPQPQGITPDTSDIESGSISEEGQEPPEESERQTLADEGSEDDWMNLVAKETLEAESQGEIEEDKARHEEGKSLQDILSDMTSGVEDE